MAAYSLIEQGTVFDTIEAENIDAACDEARESVDQSVYDTSSGTIWVDIYVRNADDADDSQQITIQVDPPEPDCTEGQHVWTTPHEIVGGLRENPGVFGHGGGVTIHEICANCGVHRRTDTWAQRPDTGEQGLTSVRYELPELDAAIGREDYDV